MSAPRVARGERRKQALEFIRRKQVAGELWTSTELATELGISLPQAGQIIASLTLAGELVRGKRTVTISDALLVPEQQSAA